MSRTKPKTTKSPNGRAPQRNVKYPTVEEVNADDHKYSSEEFAAARKWLFHTMGNGWMSEGDIRALAAECGVSCLLLDELTEQLYEMGQINRGFAKRRFIYKGKPRDVEGVVEGGDHA